jgi:WD40 repeat protein
LDAGSVNAVTLSPDGKLLAPASEDKTVVAFSQDGKVLMSISHEMVRLWDAGTRKGFGTRKVLALERLWCYTLADATPWIVLHICTYADATSLTSRYF